MNDADIVMLDTTPEKFHESVYNPDIMINVPYNIVNQDIEDNINSIPVFSIYSIAEKSLDNPGINYV